MSDFYQTGVVTTLHRLGARSLAGLEEELTRYAEQIPIALIIPCLATEMDGPALPGILDQLAEVPYLERVVVALDKADESDFRRARLLFGKLPQTVRLVWLDGERVRTHFEQLEHEHLGAGAPGKGRAVWMALGYILAYRKCRVIALHDADIMTYNRDMLARLCYPVAHPALSYEYAKGYYARISDRLYGRVTRLLVTPLVRTLLRIVGYKPYLAYLDSFRYPLSGEFAMHTDLARVIRVPSDWGLEIGLLGEIHHNVAWRRICEVDIADAYDHRHRQLDGGDATGGLVGMARDIAKTLFRTLAQEGVIVSEGFFRSIRVAYLRMAQDHVARYADDAALNGLAFDRHGEGKAVEAFAHAVDQAAHEVLADPLGTPLIPNWNRVDSAFPDFLERYKAAVEADNA